MTNEELYQAKLKTLRKMFVDRKITPKAFLQAKEELKDKYLTVAIDDIKELFNGEANQNKP